MKRLGAVIASLFLCAAIAFAGTLTTIDQFKGLATFPNADKIDDGAHVVLDNMISYAGDLQAVKGRKRLNSTANSVTTVNMVCYYESSGGTKKFVVKEDTSVVTYNTDSTSRTSIASGLTNEKADCIQEGDTLYFTSVTDGLYKWTGSGSASAISGVSAPSNVTFSAATGQGGMTAGLDSVLNPIYTSDTARYTAKSGSCKQGYAYVRQATTCDNIACTSTNTGGSSSCFSGTNFVKSCATSTTYGYKITKWNSVWAIESAASTGNTATLNGNNTINYVPAQGFVDWSDSACSSSASTDYENFTITYSGKQTATTGTLASAPSAPFDGFCMYRTVANGTDYFKLGCTTSGGSTYTDGKPDSVLGNPLDTTVVPINPPKASFIETYKGVLFLAQGNQIYFTRLPVAVTSSADNYWLSSDTISISADNNITGLRKTQNSLLIFTNKNVYELTGFGVHSFRLKSILQGVGSVSNNTVRVNNNGDVLMFAGTNGVYKIRTFSNPQDDINGTVVDEARTSITHISEPDMRNIFQGIDSSIVLTVSDYPNAHAYYDADRGLYFLYIGSDCFIFNENNKTWSHEPATKMLASVWAKSANATGYGYLLDNLGFFYQNFFGYTNSGIGNTVTGHSTSSTSSTLTDSGATFNTTNDGLKGVWVAKVSSVSTTPVIEYRQISSNTGTALTVSSNWTNNPVAADTYYIGYIVTNWKTKQYNFQKPPKETQVQAENIVHNQAGSTQNLTVYLYTNKSATADNSITIDLSTSALFNLDRIGLSGTSRWFQWQFLSFVYNTSDTINPPVDIINYSFLIVPKEEE